MIRPSSLSLARHCRKSAELSGPGNENTARGNDVDRQVCAALAGGDEPTDAVAAAIVADIRQRYPDATFVAQAKIRLIDPATGDVLTAGTPDILVLGTDTLVVLDLKRRGQRLSGHLPPPSQSVQLRAYGIAACQRYGMRAYSPEYVLFDEGPIEFESGGTYDVTTWWPFIEELIELNARPVEYTTGEHCAKCWNRLRCEAFLLPVTRDATPALQPFATVGAALTSDQAQAAWDWLTKARLALKAGKELADAVEEQLEAYGRAGGTIGDMRLVQATTKGRRSGATVAELEAAGRTDLIKEGKASVSWEWKRTKEAR